METKNISTLINAYDGIKSVIKAGILDYLKDFVYRWGEEDNVGLYRSFTDDDEIAETVEYLTIMYDGGNHPEYASNGYSTVYGIGIRDEKLYLEIEDSPYYDITRIWALDELIGVYEAVMALDNFLISKLAE